MDRPGLVIVQAMMAVGLQAASVNAFLQSADAGMSALTFPVWQTLAALAAASCFARLSHAHGSADHRAAFLHVFCVCLFLPVAGQVLFLCVSLASKVFPANTQGIRFAEVETPRFEALKSHVNFGAASRLRAGLGNHDAHIADRIASVVALRSLPTRITSDMLRDLLSDPIEEIRLLAYGIPNAAEDAIAQKILGAAARLERAMGVAEKARLNGSLAELYWELVYQKLVHGELRIHTLAQVQTFAYAALALDEKQGAMWYLLGRASLLKENPTEAAAFLQRAEACRFPAQRLLPWLAEAEFLNREYARTRRVLLPLDERTLPRVLQPAVNYWTR